MDTPRWRLLSYVQLCCHPATLTRNRSQRRITQNVAMSLVNSEWKRQCQCHSAYVLHVWCQTPKTRRTACDRRRRRQRSMHQAFCAHARHAPLCQLLNTPLATGLALGLHFCKCCLLWRISTFSVGSTQYCVGSSKINLFIWHWVPVVVHTISGIFYLLHDCAFYYCILACLAGTFSYIRWQVWSEWQLTLEMYSL